MKRPFTPTGRGRVGAPRRNRALIRGAAALAACAVAASVLVLPAGAAPGCSNIVPRGDWETIGLPPFSAGGATLVDYAVRGNKLLLATNGAAVQRSTDGGCTWKETFEVASVLPPAGSGSVAIEAISMPARASSPILLMAEERIAGVARPRVYRSTNSGATFSPADTGLSPVGRPETLRVAPGAPETAYLGVSQGDDSLDQVFATEDGGATWSLRSDLGEVAKQQNISGFEVDPLVPTDLWAWGPTGAYVSKDGARTFTLIDDFAGQATDLSDVFRASPGEKSRVAFFRPVTTDMRVSLDGGGNFLSVETPAGVDSVAHGTELMEMLITANGGRVYLYLPSANAWVDLQAAPGAHDAIISNPGDTPYYARTRTTIERYAGGAVTPPPGTKRGEGPIVPSIDDLPDIEEQPARLTGPTDKMVLKPGTSRTMTYMLDLPRGQRPLDLFFLVDTTGSMKAFVDGLKVAIADVVNGLAESGISAHIGLGEYRAYPDYFPPRQNEPNFVYKRRVDLTQDMESLREALQALEHDGGGQYDAQLGALYQVATGAGQELEPSQDGGTDTGGDVPQGQQPSFRRVAEENGNPLRLVVNASNEPFGRPNNSRNAIQEVADRGAIVPPDIPTFEETADALNGQGVRQIGLELGRAPGTYEDLANMAKATNTLAPPEGVDCDGDGINEVSGGQPLVCALGGDVEAITNIAPAIVNLVKALPLRESPSMNVAQGAEVVSGVTPESYDGVPLQSGQSLPFKVTYTCTADQAGERFPVALEALGTDELLDDLRTMVVCAGLRGKDKLTPPGPPAPPLFVPAVLIPILPPVAPPTAPIPITEISSATSSQAQTQAQAQAQAAAAAQRQHQPQLAFAHTQRVRMELAKEEEYEMSAYNRREPEMPTSLALVAAASAMAFAYGLAMRNKTATQRVLARRRRY